MSGRGGAGRGQGRKRTLDSFEAFEVGERCEYLWHKAAEDQALAQHDKLWTSRMVKDEQDRTDLIRPRRPGALRDVSESIDAITAGKRLVSLELKRPHGAKAKVLADAVTWCEAQFGRIITASKVDECWKAYRRFQKRRTKQGTV
jgi:hypothetical protein